MGEKKGKMSKEKVNGHSCHDFRMAYMSAEVAVTLDQKATLGYVQLLASAQIISTRDLNADCETKLNPITSIFRYLMFSPFQELTSFQGLNSSIEMTQGVSKKQLE